MWTLDTCAEKKKPLTSNERAIARIEEQIDLMSASVAYLDQHGYPGLAALVSRGVQRQRTQLARLLREAGEETDRNEP